MAINPYQIVALHNNMLYTDAAAQDAGTRASEFAVLADNINGLLARYTRIAGVWANVHQAGDAGQISSGSWAQRNGNKNGVEMGARSRGGFFLRGVWFTDVADGTNNFRSGYIGSFCGGLQTMQFGHDPNGTSADYESIYSHAVASWPMTADFNHQFRDANNLPADGTELVVNHGSAYSKTKYMPPSTFLLHMTSTTNTIGSGNLRFSVEERPSLQIAGGGSRSPLDSSGTKQSLSSDQGPDNTGALVKVPIPTNVITGNDSTNLANQLYPYEYYNVSGQRKFNTRAMSLLFAKIFDNTSISYGFRYEEDGSDATVQQVDAQTEYLWQRSATQAGAATAAVEARVRDAAFFAINDEYYGFVMDTRCMIFSNKDSMMPLVFFDLADTWGSPVSSPPGASKPRIAGVAVTGTSSYLPTDGNDVKIFFLSESGQLVKYDFTVTGGMKTQMTSAPSIVASGEAYGSLAVSANGATLYALYGTMTADPRTTQSGLANTANIGVVSYTIGSDTWGSLNSSSLIGRHNARHLREMMRLRDGRLAIMCEDVAVSGSGPFSVSNTLGSTNIAWQLMVYDPSAASKWNTAIIRPSTPLASSTISNLDLTAGVLTVTVAHTFSSGDFVTFGKITNASYQFLNNLTLKITGISGGASFTCSLIRPNGNISTLGISAGTVVRGLQYGQDFTGNDPGYTTPTITPTWFQNPNASQIEVGASTLLLKGNWTCAQLFIVNLNSAGGAGPPSASSQTCVSNLTNTTNNIVPSAPISTGNVYAFPCDIRHNRDYVTGGGDSTTGERSIMWFGHQAPSAIASGSSGAVPLFYAPPSFSFDGNTQFSTWSDRNATNSGGQITSFDKDKWTFGNLTQPGQSPGSNPYYTFPTMFNGNYIHFVMVDSNGNVDGIPGGSIYGKSAAQSLAYVPTYWKWTGSAWAMADNWTDAALASNGYHVSSTANTGGSSSPNGVDAPLPWGLQVQFGSASGTSFALGEFHTFNVCYGNTKFARKARFSWAMFAGQTLLQTDSRAMSTQNAMSVILNETDHCSIATSGPNNISSAVLGWNSRVTWPKLNTDDSSNDDPLVMTITTNTIDPTTIFNTPSLDAVTPYTITSSGDAANAPAWWGFAGDPGRFWRSSLGPGSSPWLQIDLGASRAIVAYSLRGYFDNSDTNGSAPKSWTLQGADDSGFSSGVVTMDTQTNVTIQRGMQFTCGSPATKRYVRLVITATGNGSTPAVGMIQILSAAPSNSMNFSDISFLPHGSNVDQQGFDTNWANDANLFVNSNFVRGLKFEVSTDGSTYTNITSSVLWRAHLGHVWCFPRQEGIKKIRITCKNGFNYGTGSLGNTDVPLTAAFGPVYFYDYGVNQSTLNAARLGASASAGQSPTNPAAGSFETNNLGVASDAVTISIDGASPNQLSTVFAQNVPVGNPVTGYTYAFSNLQVEKFGVLGFWDFHSLPTGTYKVHPYYGFVLFEGAGSSNAKSAKSGTTMSITYHWGKKV